MSLQVCGYAFVGPFNNTNFLEDRSGIYIIVDVRHEGNFIIDVGESSAVKTRVTTHDRKGCWSANKIGNLAVFVLYTPDLQQFGRMQIEQEIRRNYNPGCGER